MTQTLAEHRANVIAISHDRLSADTSLDEATIELTLETRGEAHVAELLAELGARGYRPQRSL